MMLFKYAECDANISLFLLTESITSCLVTRRFTIFIVINLAHSWHILTHNNPQTLPPLDPSPPPYTHTPSIHKQK
jgi:hypothetical protein